MYSCLVWGWAGVVWIVGMLWLLVRLQKHDALLPLWLFGLLFSFLLFAAVVRSVTTGERCMQTALCPQQQEERR